MRLALGLLALVIPTSLTAEPPFLQRRVTDELGRPIDGETIRMLRLPKRFSIACLLLSLNPNFDEEVDTEAIFDRSHSKCHAKMRLAHTWRALK